MLSLSQNLIYLSNSTRNRPICQRSSLNEMRMRWAGLTRSGRSSMTSLSATGTSSCQHRQRPGWRCWSRPTAWVTKQCRRLFTGSTLPSSRRMMPGWCATSLKSALFVNGTKQSTYTRPVFFNLCRCRAPCWQIYRWVLLRDFSRSAVNQLS
jgi:hypothetical protein